MCDTGLFSIFLCSASLLQELRKKTHFLEAEDLKSSLTDVIKLMLSRLYTLVCHFATFCQVDLSVIWCYINMNKVRLLLCCIVLSYSCVLFSFSLMSCCFDNTVDSLYASNIIYSVERYMIIVSFL